jgi:GAF domain-containing protein
MQEKFQVKNSLSKENKYLILIEQLKNLLSTDDKLISNLANLSAAIMQTFQNLNWVGFYIKENNHLYLGPFQGKVACTKIEIGKGVCGTSAAKKETIIVPNVYEFPGHIFCDSDSKSEIVVPIIINNSVFGVLDIDSPEFNQFDETDKKYLEEIIEHLKTLITKYELFSNSEKMASTKI